MISVEREPVATLGLPQKHTLFQKSISMITCLCITCTYRRRMKKWWSFKFTFYMIFHSLFGYKLTKWPAISFMLAYL